MKALWDSEFMGDEPTLTVDVAENPDVSVEAFDKDSTDRVISYLIICPNGVIEYSRKLAGSVETSLNLGVVETNDEENYVKASYQIRSSL